MDRLSVTKFIHTNFGGIAEDCPWKESPEHVVFRHVDNRKWFALIAHISYRALGIDRSGQVDFINLKCDPDLIETLLQPTKILPAYHMNKRHWITIPLDGSCNAGQIRSLIELSYQLTAKKHHSARN